MKKESYLDYMIASQIFRFDKLDLIEIDNTPVLQVNAPEMIEQETCLFHKDVLNGNQYFNIMHKFVEQGISSRRATPIVRFADGEYAFYQNSLHCNGLYQQAESVESIKKAMPIHIEALKILAKSGKFASLIYPGNVRQEKKGVFSFFCRSKGDGSALKFIEFLFNNNIELTNNNYIPFYIVYAYLTSKSFGNLVSGKKICIISSDCNMDTCKQWFAQFSSYPDIVFAEIPDSYVATRWGSIKEKTLNQIPPNVDLCLVGAGIGSLLVCVDVANRFSIPAIDAGHVLNMMNGREDKSNGPRLYTIHKDTRN
ncbi:MAG: hypothetical protein ISS67_07730 [Desulfobacterales bacterium]|uniref:GT-D fold-like domain-containing protein n=1 Tax=Candidatus Desulfaltia bathyphila TaxID=2841697 RepID=A0A8J6N5Z3_9BACT|nr:hypothetical protein [Candidatus Desulfaltia bathyphila]MBL7196212.1 hypothetical protein [Desulfobacterales bacterium]MBL7208388.1 hypothetical protein [Desulfobacterales bacterium]